jgi:hypothetical protein
MVNKVNFTEKWRRAAADILLIVVGVSIALAADSWLADRAEKARTERLLNSLEVEWTAELKRMNAYLDEVNRAMAGIIRMINAHKDGPPNLTVAEAASLLQQAYYWGTFKPSEGALNTLLVDGVQNIEDGSLRLAVSSWHSILDGLVAEQAALRELGTVDLPRISTNIAQKSGKAFPDEVTGFLDSIHGMKPGDFALAAIADDEWVANQRQTLVMLARYQKDLLSVRETLKQNLTLLRERTRN